MPLTTQQQADLDYAAASCYPDTVTRYLDKRTAYKLGVTQYIDHTGKWVTADRAALAYPTSVAYYTEKRAAYILGVEDLQSCTSGGVIDWNAFKTKHDTA